ncbi:GGDEF domain-containing protein [Chondromyces apiculatus]|uniref:diguanylate cyclase n=1 Tax=Chondromyces apiculatus DSM 436 TaxID=1192034 RepID=A0A017TER3_9BACT|nr:GGDEF domain-containing protein [Chondromyces apiculatus]EYF07407.1 ggdef family protein [Chondromyces apiculatus DSM 436]
MSDPDSELDSDTDFRRTIVTVGAPAAVSSESAGPGTACLVIIRTLSGAGNGPDLGRRLQLGTGTIECGRSMQCDVPLDDDAVSRRHASVSWSGSGYVLRDLGSTNGTYVNDTAVKERVLRDGDQLKVGRTIFKFIQGGNIELSYHEEIYRLMTCDGLTQVHNKRSFDAALEREVSRASRYQRHLSLVVFDIDHFKRINDTRGHLAGDAVLRQFAALVSAHVRRDDVVARVGGEEFALLLPESPRESACGVAEKLRGLIARSPFRFEDSEIPVTSSFGVASISPETPLSALELYRQADERLYQAKREGRNRVVG